MIFIKYFFAFILFSLSIGGLAQDFYNLSMNDITGFQPSNGCSCPPWDNNNTTLTFSWNDTNDQNAIVMATSITIRGSRDCVDQNSPVTFNGNSNGVTDLSDAGCLCWVGRRDFSITLNPANYNIGGQNTVIITVSGSGVGLHPGNSSVCNNNQTLATVSLTGTGLLPVELISFEATQVNSSVYLSWVTSMELNNLGFEIQRSNDAVNWKTLTFIDGKVLTEQETTYNFVDQDPSHGINFYRLKQTDFDGATEHSEIISISVWGKDQPPFFFPNPTSDQIEIDLRGNTIDVFTLLIYDQFGIVIKTIENIKDDRTIDLRDLSSGIYIIEVVSKNNTWMKKIIKN